MRHRDLAAIAVTATVAATPTLITVAEDVTTAPLVAADFTIPASVGIGPNCYLNAPSLDQTTVETAVHGSFSKDGETPCELPGTLSLQASVDHSHWKTLNQTHQSSWTKDSPLAHQCLAGAWSYQGYFVADDGSFAGGTDTAFPTTFTC
jgi:hypothetical protein